MNEKTIVKDEFIGRQITIRECSDPSWINKSGRIIDETKNTFLLEIDNKQRRIAKNIVKFEFEYDGEKIVLNGSRLMYRPEDRIKKAR